MLLFVEFHDVRSAIAVVALMSLFAVANVKVLIVEERHGFLSFVSCDGAMVGVGGGVGAVVT